MIPAFMTRQIGAAQDQFLEQILGDQKFLAAMAAHVQHAKLAEVLPPPPARVLELGCGPGKYVAMLARLGYAVVGVDPFSFPTWDVIRQRTGAELIDGVRGEQLPFPDRSFDHVVFLGTLLYVDDPDRVMSEVARVIKPGGRLVVRTVNRANLYSRRTGRVIDPASKNLYSITELANLVRRFRFRVDDQFAYGLLPPAFKNLWWYLVSVWLPLWMQDLLSNSLPPAFRWNNTVVATALEQ
jgi:ubiquinone/menaquinone biosynthesis C-methylase UbiE